MLRSGGSGGPGFKGSKGQVFCCEEDFSTWGPWSFCLYAMCSGCGWPETESLPGVQWCSSGLPICVWGQVVAIWSRRRSPAGPSYSSIEGYCSILCKKWKHTRCLPLSSLCTSIFGNFAVCYMIHMGAIARSTLGSKVCDCSWILFSVQREGKVQSVQGPNAGRQKNGQLKRLPGQVARRVWGIGWRVSVFIKDFGDGSKYFIADHTVLF